MESNDTNGFGANNTTNFSPVETCTLANSNAFILYIILGFLSLVSNSWMGGTILRVKSLRRKEMLVFCGLAMGDAIFGLANIITGCRRLQLACEGRMKELVSISFCQKEIHPLMLLVGNQLSSIMMLLLSIDRLMAVVMFHTYIGLTKRYSMFMVCGAMLFAVTSVAIGLVDAIIYGSDEKIHPAICPATYAVDPWYAKFNTIFNTVCSAGSIILYVIVVIANFMRVKKMTAVVGASSNATSEQMKTQQRLTKTLGIVSFCTLFGHTIPWFILVFATSLPNLMKTVGPYMGVPWCLNACANILIFAWRHKTLRAHLFCNDPEKVGVTVTAARVGAKGQTTSQRQGLAK